MNVIFSDMPLPRLAAKSVFLAGPTPRGDAALSWRPQAIETLTTLGYKGDVLVPERRDWKVKFAYEDQVEWETEGLGKASDLLFWVPRKASHMLALTTNLEFGYWVGKRPDFITYGRPDDAENCRYLDWFFKEHTNRIIHNTLTNTLKAIL